VLAHNIVASKTTEPERYMLFLHGILGTRANWRGVARRFVEARPAWGAVLVDLREHGDSLGFEGPHTLTAVASDVAGLERSLGLPVEGALGHSFGGKVVLRWLRDRAALPTEAWIIDASPSTNLERVSSATTDVLEILSRLPRQWPSREAFVAAVTDAGQPDSIAQWLAMNLRRTDDGGRVFGPSLDAIEALLVDYAHADLWDVVESPPPYSTLDFVIGGRSNVFSEADLSRLSAIAEQESQVSAHVIEEAGHWVHVDSADALVSLLSADFA
jgi:esterase